MSILIHIWSVQAHLLHASLSNRWFDCPFIGLIVVRSILWTRSCFIAPDLMHAVRWAKRVYDPVIAPSNNLPHRFCCPIQSTAAGASIIASCLFQPRNSSLALLLGIAISPHSPWPRACYPLGKTRVWSCDRPIQASAAVRRIGFCRIYQWLPRPSSCLASCIVLVSCSWSPYLLLPTYVCTYLLIWRALGGSHFSKNVGIFEQYIVRVKLSLKWDPPAVSNRYISSKRRRR